MVTNKQRIPCFDSEVLVNDVGGGTYELAIQAGTNPLGKGNRLEAFPTLEQALQAAEQFCQLYAVARERGYYLKENAFVKPDRASVPIKECLTERFGVEQLQAKLE
ncbi:hypothetical protein [Paenibacillus sp. J31TS4]|uniref:hypothetical protein n=1 Tax=Paenibacillus sp. J31TS4 TaxID=2807195 RepID=UPI001BCF407B|nr:hypothetical protein [Paenibacillus sp. J31TS4]